jgi:hypothetical protein
MTKKTVKLMMAISLTTVFGLLAFMESAEAQRSRGNTYSETSINQTDVLRQFSLVDTTPEGNSIVDQAPGNNNLGVFSGAIEDYTLGTGSLCSSASEDQIQLCEQDGISSGYLNFGSFGNVTTGFFNPQAVLPGVGDLRVELINDNLIQYTIFSPGNSMPPTRHILDFSSDQVAGNAFRPTIQLPSNFDQNQAINSVSYILENNLLGATKVKVGTSDFNLIVLQNQIEEEIPNFTTVPEPSATASLWALGTLGAGSVLKRKMKQSLKA